MKSMKMKVVAVVLACSILATVICGAIAIINATKTSMEENGEILTLQTETLANQINAKLMQVSKSVDTLAGVCLSELKDFEKFKTSESYVNSYTESLSSVLLESAKNTTGAMTSYIRYNPEFTNPTSGIFFSRDSGESDFETVVPTDFTMYEPTDLEHVGWYYTPVNNGKPTWMDPYMNQNINVYMISYVVPLFIDGESVGIVGMDIDFTDIQKTISNTKFYNTGYGYLANEANSVLYHPNLDPGTDLTKESKYGMKEAAAVLSDIEKVGKMQSFKVSGTKYGMSYAILDNGMRLASSVPHSEVIARASTVGDKIFWGAVISLAISFFIGLVFSLYVTKPLKLITNIIMTISNLDFRKNATTDRLAKRKDETGKMAEAVIEMQMHIGEAIGKIEHSSLALRSNIRGLEDTTKVIDGLSVENSATSEELAASMEETAASTAVITQNVDEVTQEARSISELSQNGVKDAKEVQERAFALRDRTVKATEETNRVYAHVSQKSEEAISQAKAVDKINEMTNAITEISSQTNLLALNASIEAARAGDAGKGFAVVATEIGNLANQTLETVTSIDGIVQEVVRAVENMSSCLKNSTDFLEKTVLTDYKDFSDVSNQYTEDAMEFDNSMLQIQKSIENLTTSMNGINSAITEINTTVNEATEGVSNIAESSMQMKDGVKENQTKVNVSVDSIHDLEEVIEQFTVK